MNAHHENRQEMRGTLSLGAAVTGVAAFLLAMGLAVLTHASRTEASKNGFGALLLLSLVAEATAVVVGLPVPRTGRGRMGLRIGVWSLAIVTFAWVRTALGL